MRLVDANVLIYAVNSSDPKHREARDWLDGALNATEPLAFAWASLLAFIRLSTKVGLFPSPLAVDDALQRVGAWLTQPNSVILQPTTRHLAILTGLLTTAGTGGNLASDAHLAALAVEHGASLVTYDADFGRFEGLEWQFPRDATEPRSR